MHFLGIDGLLTRALGEDTATGDITTICCISEDSISRGALIAKESGMICGLDVARRVFALVDQRVLLREKLSDGDLVEKGAVIAEIEGPSRGILIGERVALNFMQRMSGIATKTAHAVNQVAGTKAKIADTRKTSPGLRVLEKYAVRTGGGHNHRFSLSDGILIKDNHIRAAGSITRAVEAVRRHAPHTLRIEVETETMEQVSEALSAAADIILLDNMDLETMARAVELISGRALVEASGNMEDRDLKAVARTGVDIISIGALTNSVRSLDISLRLHE